LRSIAGKCSFKSNECVTHDFKFNFFLNENKNETK